MTERKEHHLGCWATGEDPVDCFCGRKPDRKQPCAFYWTIRNHPRFDECSDQWCAVHDAWKREELPRDVCEAVTPATARQQS